MDTSAHSSIANRSASTEPCLRRDNPASLTHIQSFLPKEAPFSRPARQKRVARSYLQPIEVDIRLQINVPIPLRRSGDDELWGALIVETVQRYVAEAIRAIPDRIRPLHQPTAET